MVISDKYKYIFLAVPKTGTSSVSMCLLENDSSAERNRVVLQGGEVSVPEHITAEELRSLMGAKFQDYRKVAFVRDPYSKILSAYYFYKKGRAADKVASKERRGLKIRMIVFLAKLLPFPLWAVFYPIRSSSEFLVNKKGDVLVDYIGSFENLNEDFYSIFEKLGVSIPRGQLPLRNVTEYNRDGRYVYNPLIKYLLSIKVRKDLQLFRKIMADK